MQGVCVFAGAPDKMLQHTQHIYTNLYAREVHERGPVLHTSKCLIWWEIPQTPMHYEWQKDENKSIGFEMCLCGGCWTKCSCNRWRIEVHVHMYALFFVCGCAWATISDRGCNSSNKGDSQCDPVDRFTKYICFDYMRITYRATIARNLEVHGHTVLTAARQHRSTEANTDAQINHFGGWNWLIVIRPIRTNRAAVVAIVIF